MSLMGLDKDLEKKIKKNFRKHFKKKSFEHNVIQRFGERSFSYTGPPFGLPCLYP